MFTLALFLIAIPTTICAGSVRIDIPLNEQLPQIARINQPFSWSFSPLSFHSTEGSLTYTVSSMPDWLSFDPDTFTFHGTPAARDEGNPSMTVKAHDSVSSASSAFTLCVTPFSPPTLNLPVQDQFRPDNPSLSSIFVVSNNSAIKSVNPALRVPPRWSFSIGLAPDTFKSPHNIYYEALSPDGSALPDWMIFRPKSMTLNGVTPYTNGTQVHTVVLHASDQEGYTAATAPFDLIVASDELSIISSSLPTINMTAATPSSIYLTSAVDFLGVMVNSKPINASDIKALSVDTTSYRNWLKYDPQAKLLSGTPPDGPQTVRDPLPVMIETTFNQSLRTQFSINIVPSYFSASILPSIVADKDGKIHFDLGKYYSPQTAVQRSDVTLSVAYNVTGAERYLQFDASNGKLEGGVPDDFPADISITFTAYSRVTRSTSHTRLDAHFPENSRYHGLPNESSQLQAKKHRAMVISLVVTLTLVGIVVFFFGLAISKRCLRTKDTALVGDEALAAMSEKDREWYNQDVEQGQRRGGVEMRRSSANLKYGHLGVKRYPHAPSSQANGSRRHLNVVGSPTTMSKSDFVSRLKHSIYQVGRQVSDTYTRKRARPQISKPAPWHGRRAPPYIDGLPETGELSRSMEVNASPIASQISHPTGSLLDSAFSTSPTGFTEASSPSRKSCDRPPPAHLREERRSSRSSDMSRRSMECYASEVEVSVATRTPSIKNGKQGFARRSVEDSRVPSPPLPPPVAGPPRVTAFTHQSQVPAPHSPTSSPGYAPAAQGRNRIESYVAQPVQNGELAQGPSGAPAVVITPSKSGIAPQQFFGRVGTRFRQKVITNELAHEVLRVRLANGRRLPEFLERNNTKLASRKKGFVEFEGTPQQSDAETYAVEIYSLRDVNRVVGEFKVKVS